MFERTKELQKYVNALDKVLEDAAEEAAKPVAIPEPTLPTDLVHVTPAPPTSISEGDSTLPIEPAAAAGEGNNSAPLPNEVHFTPFPIEKPATPTKRRRPRKTTSSRSDLERQLKIGAEVRMALRRSGINTVDNLRQFISDKGEDALVSEVGLGTRAVNNLIRKLVALSVPEQSTSTQPV